MRLGTFGMSELVGILMQAGTFGMRRVGREISATWSLLEKKQTVQTTEASLCSPMQATSCLGSRLAE